MDFLDKFKDEKAFDAEKVFNFYTWATGADHAWKKQSRKYTFYDDESKKIKFKVHEDFTLAVVINGDADIKEVLKGIPFSDKFIKIVVIGLEEDYSTF